MLAYIRYPTWLTSEIIPGLPIRWYGLMYLVAFVISYLLFMVQAREKKMDTEKDKDTILNFFFWGILGLVVGGRVSATLLFSGTDLYLRKPWLIFWPFSGGQYTGLQGMNYYGGLVGVVLALVIYARVRKIDIREWGDMLVAGAPLGYTFGRLGNFINGELYGRVTAAPWGFLFPHASSVPLSDAFVRETARAVGLTPAQGVSMVNLPRHPTQLYEALLEGIVLWLILWFVFRKRKPFKGFLIGMYVLGYGVACTERVTGAEDLITARIIAAKLGNPNLVAVYRPEQAWVSPQDWVAQSADTLHRVADAMEAAGLPRVYGKLFWMQSRNEVYSSSDHTSLLYWRDVEITLISELARVEPRVGACVFNCPVGNPNEWEYPDLIPLARAVEVNSGLMGYHAYWFGSPTQYGMTAEHWPYLQGRWTVMDEVFAKAGVHPRWFFGETGLVGGTYFPATTAKEMEAGWQAAMESSPWEAGHWHEAEKVWVNKQGLPVSVLAVGTGGGYQLLPNDGWMSPVCVRGDLSRYVSEGATFLEWMDAWNKLHGGRAVGGVLFTSGALYTGWPSFQVQGVHWDAFGKMMLGKWPKN